ncbi:MAG: hypothetical protein AB7F35_01185 [Acetobacteraceae bacterium]
MVSIVSLEGSRWIDVPSSWSNKYRNAAPIRVVPRQVAPDVPFYKVDGLTAAKGVVYGSLFGGALWLMMGGLMFAL